eukprot:scaffold2.g7414.t1
MATAVDMNVQHGFHVRKDASQLYKPPLARAAADGADGADARRAAPPPAVLPLSRLSGLSSVAAASAAAPPVPAPVQPAPHAPPAAGSPPVGGSLQVGEHAHLSSGCKRLLKSVVRGLKACQDPEAATEGLGGTYFFTNELGVKIAIMKPCDEEPMAPNNPKAREGAARGGGRGFVGRQLGEPGLKPTVRVGEAASREVAAYLLDHGHFAKVPHTVMVKMAHPVFHVAAGAADDADPDAASSASSDAESGGGGPPTKLGSLQEFVPHDCDTSEMGASRFAVRDVHRIGILDIRLLNTDRHAGNILVRRARGGGGSAPPGAGAGATLLDANAYELIPIDHGFALPEALEPPYFEWQHWPQAMMPFGREELEYIASLDAAADVAMLRRELPSLREESLRLLEVSTTLLKACAAAGMSLAEIAGVVTRPLIGLDEEPSELERLCFEARAEVDDGGAASAAGELTDLEEEDEGEEGAQEDGGGADSEGPGPVGQLSPEAGASPSYSAGSASASAATHFQLALSLPAASDASRVLCDDGLFCMDMDGGARSPGLAASPAGLPPLARVLRAGSGDSAASQPRTPAGALLAPAAFVSPPSTGDSLSASFDSMSLADGSVNEGALPAPERGDDGAGGAAPGAASAGGPRPMSLASAGTSAFAAPASYVPGFAGARTQQRPKLRRRRPVLGNRSRKRLPSEARRAGGRAAAAVYPPLWESRSPPAARLFSDMDGEQWALFMEGLGDRLSACLACGAWKTAPTPSAVGMSCPRF